MYRLSFAQQLLIALGVEPQLVLFGSHKEHTVHHTKRGPGRTPSIQR